MPLISADVSEVMKSCQKDIEVIHNCLNPLLNRTVRLFLQLWKLGCRSSDERQSSSYLHTQAFADLSQWSRETKLLTDLLYYAATTISGQQTLGEEYVYIVQIFGSTRYHPKFLPRMAMVGLHCICPYAVERLIHFCIKYVNENSWIAERKKHLIKEFLNHVNHVTAWCFGLQRSLFFLKMTSENFSKHLTHINYASVRRTPLRHNVWFSVLGYLGVIQAAATFTRGVTTAQKALQQSYYKGSTKSTTRTANQSRCPLCYDRYDSITSTPCGHLFCWKCVYPWSCSTGQCPICRVDCKPKQLVLLVNFVL
ncbi:peroxisome assembly protein 10-A-like [Watersipora subatra]|uniref:peroxisome assembly protein 10-A-like n=1 Tax=Watersipora subatra TaxID=2589382 RepID=UPI00355AF270